jgi:aminoglycoside/choline kinase family phosphotransferase
MARNLALPSPRRPRLILLDHQDLRLGPRLYDLASLLNDSLFAPPALEAALLRRLAPDDESRLGYHRAAAQRTLKAAGTFQAFALRGVERHLRLIPPTLERSLYHLARLPETATFAGPLEVRWRPRLSSLAESG